ncbi:hypothetical protein FRC08_011121 [Ceratobasidium sp. 394]|nr:hypothetical protein FRC08_011121 [Ceratobasidium sp. 394]
MFPPFPKRIQAENADSEAIVRLLAFHDLGRLRIVFRLIFVIPLLVVALRRDQSWWTSCDCQNCRGRRYSSDGGGIGCVVSSVITLLIFFPRSIAREAGYATRARTHAPQMQSKSGRAPITKNHAIAQQPGVPQQQQSAQSQRDASFSIQQRDMRSPGSSNFPYSPGFPRSPGLASRLQNELFAETTSVTRPQHVHRRTISSSQ